MQLTAHIMEAIDGWLSLEVDEIPPLVIHARSVGEIPEAVRSAAAKLLGRHKEDLEVDLRF